MASYQEARVKLTNTQSNKLKSAEKNKTGKILRINKKNFEVEELSDELFLRTKQATKINNAFANNMSTNIKFNKVQISKIIQSGGSWFLVRKIRKQSTSKYSYSVSQRQFIWITSYVINKFERKISGTGPVRAEKAFTLFIWNEDINYIIKIIKSLEDLGVLIDGVTETVKHEIKKQEVEFLGALLAFLVISSVVKGINVRELEEQKENIWIKIFSFNPSFKQYQDY